MMQRDTHRPELDMLKPNVQMHAQTHFETPAPVALRVSVEEQPINPATMPWPKLARAMTEDQVAALFRKSEQAFREIGSSSFPGATHTRSKK